MRWHLSEWFRVCFFLCWRRHFFVSQRERTQHRLDDDISIYSERVCVYVRNVRQQKSRRENLISFQVQPAIKYKIHRLFTFELRLSRALVVRSFFLISLLRSNQFDVPLWGLTSDCCWLWQLQLFRFKLIWINNANEWEEESHARKMWGFDPLTALDFKEARCHNFTSKMISRILHCQRRERKRTNIILMSEQH